MSEHFSRGLAGVVAVLLGVLALPARAEAQSIGFGPRFAFVRGDVKADSSTRYSGGLLRLGTSPRTAIELSLDYRSHLNEDLTTRIKEYPIQGSLLLYPVRSTVSPYILGGIGWYKQNVAKVDGEEIVESVATRRTGYHAGVGGEIWFGRHATLHVDYRYTFIRFGKPGEEAAATQPGAIPIPGLGGLQDSLKLSHEGSMWTSGVTLYF